jgi:DNA primase
MNAAKYFTYFNQSFELKRQTRKGWYPMDCPFCDFGRNKLKFAVHFIYDSGKCWECEYRGSLIQVVMDFLGIEYRQAKNLLNDQEESMMDIQIVEYRKTVQKQSILLPKGYLGILEGEGILSERARNYLTGRRYNLDKLDSMGFGYCIEHDENYVDDYFGYIILPFKSQGLLKYYIGRDFMGNQDPKYKNPAEDKFGIGKSDLLFNEDAMSLYDEVFLLEGVFDSLDVGPAAMASMGWSLSDTQKLKILKSDAKRLVVIPDKGYYSQAVKTASDFLDHKEVVVINMDNVLPEEPDKGDVNEIGVALVMEEYEKTPILTQSLAMEVLLN